MGWNITAANQLPLPRSSALVTLPHAQALLRSLWHRLGTHSPSLGQARALPGCQPWVRTGTQVGSVSKDSFWGPIQTEGHGRTTACPPSTDPGASALWGSLGQWAALPCGPQIRTEEPFSPRPPPTPRPWGCLKGVNHRGRQGRTYWVRLADCHLL